MNIAKRNIADGLFDTVLETKHAIDVLDKEHVKYNKPAEFTIRNEKYIFIDVDALVGGKYQPRGVIKRDDKLEELSNSIKSQGIIQPIIVRIVESNKYEIVAGERRWRAAKLADLKSVPCVIRKIDNKKALAFSLIENIQRENLNPIEESLAYEKLVKEFKMSHEEVAITVGKSRSSVSNFLRLLKLDSFVQDLVKTNQLDMGHARSLLSLEPALQVELAKRVVNKKLSTRQVEEMVKNINNPTKVGNIISSELQDKFNNLTDRLSSRLSSKIKIIPNAKGEGRAVIYFSSLDEIEWLANKLEEK